MATSESGTFTCQGAQSAIRNPLKARQCCDPPRSAIRHAEHSFRRSELELCGPKNGLKMGLLSSRA
eukprot:6453451-Alexandrium_andersonii.AAC.1